MSVMSELEYIVKPLLSWYDGHARILPWREQVSPYRVWVSEIMLQQTRVEAVKPFFERFIRALPDVQALAGCPEDELLKLWEGLGYYNRVRNMQKAARVIVEEYKGVFPADFQKLLALPGIGRYTAGAVGSIAFGLTVPAVDGNVLRVLSRVTASDEDIFKQSVKTSMERKVAKILPKDRPGDFNQAMMELGAVVCIPGGRARCEVCPLASGCKARLLGLTEELPVRKAKKERKVEKRTVFVLRDGDKVAIRKRPLKGLLAGMYELPNLSGSLTQEEALDYIKEQGFSPVRILPLADTKHIFTHVEWQMTGYMVSVEETKDRDPEGLFFIEAEETQKKYPIPAAFAAYARSMDIVLGQEKYEDAELQ
ncbi:MAG TPA: A/G-specific adenine glycosylase [Lachnospiraceae bacterium]|nr:A/G-specific adenine glycosylase [Lachnospiraceae bacterium]